MKVASTTRLQQAVHDVLSQDMRDNVDQPLNEVELPTALGKETYNQFGGGMEFVWNVIILLGNKSLMI